MPEIYYLIEEHLFPNVGSRTWLAEILLLCIPCVHAFSSGIAIRMM